MSAEAKNPITASGPYSNPTLPLLPERQCSEQKTKTKTISVILIFLISFPFYSSRRFGGNVIDHAVDASHFVDYPAGHSAKQLMRHVEPVGNHAILAGDGTQSASVFISALVARP